MTFRALLLAAVTLLPLPALSQQVTSLPNANLPLSGAEYVYLVQGGFSRKTPINSVVGAGTGVTITGTPQAGNLTMWSGINTITAGNLSGDCTTTNTLAITCTKSGGVALGTMAFQNANAVAITGGTISGLTALGSTGAATLTGGVYLDSAGIGGIPNTSLSSDGNTISFKSGNTSGASLSLQFDIGNAPGAIEQWRAIGGLQGTGPVFLAKSQLSGDNVTGVFAAQNTGGFLFGNYSGPLASFIDGGGINAEYLTFKPATTGNRPTISVTGATSSLGLNINGRGNGSVVIGSGNGVNGVFSDPNAVGVPHNAYLRFEAGVTTGPPNITVDSSDASEAITVTSKGNGSVQLGNDDGPLVSFGDGNGAGTAAVGYFVFTTQTSGGTAPTITASGSTNNSIKLLAKGTGTALVSGAGTGSVQLGIAGDKVGFGGTTPITKATPVGACAGNTGCQALRDALGNLGLINTGSITN